MSDTVITIRREIIEEIVKRLNDELKIYRAIINKFREKYGCSLKDLEMKIEREGVPVSNHEIWEDSIEWRNAVEEVEKLIKILRELKT